MRRFILTIVSTLALAVSIYAQDDKLNPIRVIAVLTHITYRYADMPYS